MTTGANNQVKAAAEVLEYPILSDGNGDINQGDNVYFDTSDKVVKAVGSNANAATYAGVAADNSYVNLYGTKKYLVTMPVFTKGIFQFTSVNGETYNHGDSVYFSTDAQTVTPTDPGSGNVMGKVWLQNGQSAITGTGSNKVPVLIMPKYPVAGGL